MSGLEKNKLVLLGVDTGFIMDMSVCPRKLLQHNNLSDSGALEWKKKKIRISHLGELGRNDFFSHFIFTLFSSFN